MTPEGIITRSIVRLPELAHEVLQRAGKGAMQNRISSVFGEVLADMPFSVADQAGVVYHYTRASVFGESLNFPGYKPKDFMVNLASPTQVDRRTGIINTGPVTRITRRDGAITIVKPEQHVLAEPNGPLVPAAEDYTSTTISNGMGIVVRRDIPKTVLRDPLMRVDTIGHPIDPALLEGHMEDTALILLKTGAVLLGLATYPDNPLLSAQAAISSHLS